MIERQCTYTYKRDVFSSFLIQMTFIDSNSHKFSYQYLIEVFYINLQLKLVSLGRRFRSTRVKN